MASLHVHTLFAGLLGLALAIPVQAQAHCHTRWVLSNSTGKAVYLGWVNQREPELNFSLAEAIPAHGQAEHCWGDWQYNDGLGLSPGTWTVAVATSAAPLDQPGAVSTQFSTTWGEAVHLQVEEKGGKLVLRKR